MLMTPACKPRRHGGEGQYSLLHLLRGDLHELVGYTYLPWIKMFFRGGGEAYDPAPPAAGAEGGGFVGHNEDGSMDEVVEVVDRLSRNFNGLLASGAGGGGHGVIYLF